MGESLVRLLLGKDAEVHYGRRKMFFGESLWIVMERESQHRPYKLVSCYDKVDEAIEALTLYDHSTEP